MKVVDKFTTILAAILLIMFILLKMDCIGRKNFDMVALYLVLFFFIANLVGAFISKKISSRLGNIDLNKNPKTFYLSLFLNIIILIAATCYILFGN